MMPTAMKRMFLAAILCALAAPAGSQQTAGEAANLEKKETGVDAERPAVRPHTPGKRAQANRHNTRVVTARSTTHPTTTPPKAAVVQRAGTRQQRTAKLAKLKTGQLTSSQSAKLQTKQAALHREGHPDREENGNQQTADEKAQASHRQKKLSHDIHLKKHNARMF